jgi:hypothetical protein
MQEIITGVLLNVVVALIGLGGAFATMLLSKAKAKVEVETEKLNDERQRELVTNAFGSLHDIAIKTVTKIEQTTADSLRQAVKDGKVDREELIALSDQAYDTIFETMKPQYIEVLENELGNIGEYVNALIEEKVHELKIFRICKT